MKYLTIILVLIVGLIAGCGDRPVTSAERPGIPTSDRSLHYVCINGFVYGVYTSWAPFPIFDNADRLPKRCK